MDKIEERKLKRKQEQAKHKKPSAETVGKVEEQGIEREERVQPNAFSLSGTSSALEKAKFAEISVDRISSAFSHQARRVFNSSLIKNMADSIETDGFFQNIVVVEKEDRTYMIVAGETRYRAAKEAQVAVILAFIYPFGTDMDKLIKLSVKENMNRGEPSNYEYYTLFSTLLEDKKVVTQSDIYKYFDGSISISRIKKIMTFEELHPSIIEDTRTGEYVVNLDVAVSIRKIGRKLIKEHIDMSAKEVYEEYILPVYQEVKEKKVSVDRAISLFENLVDDKKKKETVSSNRSRILVDIKDLSARQKKELELKIKEIISEIAQ